MTEQATTDKRTWQCDVKEVESLLDSSASRGLTDTDAAERLARFGSNQLREKKGRSPLGQFLDQFKNLIIWVLIGAATVSGFLGEWVDALAIIAIVILNAVMGFVQEYRAEKSLAALKKLSSPSSKVIRDGDYRVVPSSDIVPGDLVELEAGDNVPADGRVVWHTSNFLVQEASLTGESTPVLKTAVPLDEREVPLADRANTVYMGTSVASGKARALVTGTGMATELGKIAEMIQGIAHETTPLQKKLEQFGRWIVYLCFILVGLVFLMEWLRGGKIVDVFLTAVSLAVAAIPEGLPAVVTIALALGVQRMVRRHALIRKLPSVETLGCATVICSDKTGTLTRNEMTVQAAYADARLFRVTGIGYTPEGGFMDADASAVDPSAFRGLRQMLQVGVLCNSAVLVRKDGGAWGIFGDPTEAAILTAAAKLGVLKETEEKGYPAIEELPFDSERKKMTIIRQDGSRFAAFVKGAPDILIGDCTSIDEGDSTRPMTEADRARLLRVNDELADRAMRVLAFAYRSLEELPENPIPDRIERELVFAGMMAMIDPPREEAKAAVAECKRAGIRTVMITGDHKNTAVAIARELGFLAEDSMALTGQDLDGWTDERLGAEVRRIPVYARVSPEHKLRIVRAWRKRGDVVAMTGDGVNDAPAVKEADIGVAMGITGTDVTKEVSDMVVTDDNFASIVAAVEEGRGIYDNIKKFVHYLLSCNAGEILTMFTASLVGLPVPLLPIHILWVNLVTDGLPALALGVDPVDPGIMDKPPRDPAEPVVTRPRAFLMLAQGAFIAFCSLLAFCAILFIEKEGVVRARTGAFIVLSCSQLFHAFNCRNMIRSLFRIGPFSNMKLVYAAAVSFFLQVVVINVPFLRTIFKVEQLSLLDWGLVLAISSFPLWAMEAVKAANRRFRFYSV
jgi:Ca2+-transporting ATPase